MLSFHWKVWPLHSAIPDCLFAMHRITFALLSVSCFCRSDVSCSPDYHAAAGLYCHRGMRTISNDVPRYVMTSVHSEVRDVMCTPAALCWLAEDARGPRTGGGGGAASPGHCAAATTANSGLVSGARRVSHCVLLYLPVRIVSANHKCVSRRASGKRYFRHVPFI